MEFLRLESTLRWGPPSVWELAVNSETAQACAWAQESTSRCSTHTLCRIRIRCPRPFQPAARPLSTGGRHRLIRKFPWPQHTCVRCRPPRPWLGVLRHHSTTLLQWLRRYSSGCQREYSHLRRYRRSCRHPLTHYHTALHHQSPSTEIHRRCKKRALQLAHLMALSSLKGAEMGFALATEWAWAWAAPWAWALGASSEME